MLHGLHTSYLALSSKLQGADPVTALKLINNLVQATTDVASLSQDNATQNDFYNELVDFGFQYAALNPIDTPEAVDNGAIAFLNTIQKANTATDIAKQQATGKFSDLFKGLDTNQKRVQMLEFGDRLLKAAKELPTELQAEKQDAKLISAIVELGGAYAVLKPSGSPTDGKFDLFLNTLWHATSGQDILEGGKELSNFLKAFKPEQRLELLRFESSVLRSIEQVLEQGQDVLLPVAPDGLRVDDELLVTQIGPGLWEPPGDQPIPFYLGDQAHRGIAAQYVAAHLADRVFPNFFPISTILSHFQQLGQNVNRAALTQSELDQKPDILNPTLQHIYEIKPISQANNAIPQAERYRQIFGKAGITIRLGPSNEPGTSGIIEAPGGYYIFASPNNGAIIYRYHRGTYDSNFAQQIGAALGLGGIAALLYLIFSEGGSLLIPQPQTP